MTEAELLRLAEGCVHCGKCLPGCPLLRLTGREESSPRGKLALLKWGLGCDTLPEGFLAPFLACTFCLRCQDTCPAGLDLESLFLAARRIALPAASRPTPRQSAARALGLTTGECPRPEEPHGTQGKTTPQLLLPPLSPGLPQGFRDGAERILGEGQPPLPPRWPLPVHPLSLYERGRMEDLQALLSGLPKEVPSLTTDPDVAELAARFAPEGTGEILSPAGLLPRLLRENPDRLRLPEAPFVLLPPAPPLNEKRLEVWEEHWETAGLPGRISFPSTARPLRGELLLPFAPRLARTLAEEFLALLRERGARSAVISSPRTWRWLHPTAAQAGFALLPLTDLLAPTR